MDNNTVESGHWYQDIQNLSTMVLGEEGGGRSGFTTIIFSLEGGTLL